MKNLNKINIVYTNPNKFVNKGGYEDCFYDIDISKEEIDFIILSGITSRIDYVNDEFKSINEVGSFNIKLKKVYNELLESGISITRITLEGNDTISYEVTGDKKLKVTSDGNKLDINY